MSKYTAFYEYVTPVAPETPRPVVEFEAFGSARANAVAARYARDNVLELTAVVDLDEAAGPFPVAA